MNLFQLVTKNMRQRALSTWLTLLSVTLGVGLAIAQPLRVMGRDTDALFGQKNFGYDILVGKKGSQLQLVLNTIYHMDVSPGNIPFEVYGPLTSGDLQPYVKLAVPRTPIRASTASSALCRVSSALAKMATPCPPIRSWNTSPMRATPSTPAASFRAE